jgi:hypothetical protein
MGFLDRLFGSEPQQRPRQPQPPTTDEQALERYRYMLETAPPDTIERAHEEAFAKLTPEQRRQVLAGLAQAAPAGEREAIAATPPNDTRALARAATRAEIRQPGVMERTLSGGGMGLGASLLSSFAMGFVGSMVATSFMSAMSDPGGDGGNDGDGAADGGETADNSGGDDGGFDGGGDFGGGDFDV